MAPLFGFVQFELTHAIGPHAGRYVVAHAGRVDGEGAALRSDDLTRREMLTGVTMKPGTADVLAVTVHGGTADRPRLRRRARAASDDEDAPAAVPILRVAFVRAATPYADRAAAEAALDAIAAEEDRQVEWVDDGLAVVNRAVRAYRAGARDPYVTEIARRDARVVRIGFGTTEQVAEGGWTRAIVLPPALGAKPTREERLAPAETTADVLAGRGTVLEAEDVLLRGWADLDHGRVRAAALQAHGAARLLRAEFAALDADPGIDLGEMVDRTAELAAAAIDEPGRPALDAEIEAALRRLERAVERWRYAGVTA